MDGVERSVKSLSFNVCILCHSHISLIKELYKNGGHDWTPEINAVKSQLSLLSTLQLSMKPKSKTLIRSTTPRTLQRKPTAR